MSKYQFPPLKDEKEFEFLINDLCIEKYGIEFQVYGRKGQIQNGIDGLSFSGNKKLIVYQCKNKTITRDDKKIKYELLEDINNEVVSANAEFKDIDTFIFANSYKQDTVLQDRAIKLSKDYGFTVIVWSWEEIENLLEKYLDIAKNYYPEIFDKNILSEKDIKNKFQENSVTLLVSRNYYIEKSFIDTPEVNKIIDFIYNDSQESNLLVLSGKAGIGKTAILSKIQTILIEKKETYLSIKSDQFEIESKEALSNYFGVNNILLAIIKIARKERVTVLIDQLDALSLTMTSNKKTLNIILEFIEQLKDISNVKVIVSIRDYDLKNDPLFKSLDSGNIINTQLLDYDYVKSKLRSFISESTKLSSNLIELLRTPLHLSIFLEIYPNDNSCISIKTIQDLYNKFWEQKIQDKSLDRTTRKNLINLLKSIVNKMSNLNRIEIPKLYFEDEYEDEITLLLSKNIIKEENSKISFFHQTFYDYIFARYFVQNEHSLYKYILNTTQDLSIREQLKQIIQFLRGTDEENYLFELKNILYSDRVRFHIKLLLITFLGSIEKPTDAEFNFVQQLFKDYLNYEKYFVESWISSDWLVYFYKSGFFNVDNFKKYNLQYKLEIFINSKTDLVFEIIDRCVCEEKIKNIAIINCLNRLDNWTEKSFEIFKKYHYLLYEKDVRFYRHKDIYKITYNFNSEYAINIFFNVLNKKIDLINDNKKRILDKEWFEIFVFLLEQKDNIDILKKLLKIIQKISEKFKYEYSKNEFLITDKIFDCGMWQFENIYKTKDFYSRILEKISIIAQKGKKLFLELMKPYKETNYLSLITFFIFGYSKNPNLYKKGILKLFINIKFLEELNFKCHNGYKFLLLLKDSFILFDESEQRQIFNSIIKVNPKWQNKTFLGKWDNKPVYLGTYRGLQKYKLLYQLDIDVIKKFGYFKEYQELQRKFYWYKLEKPYKSKGGSVGAPLSSDVYSKMSLSNWLQSMKVFNGTKTRNSSDFLRGDIVQHYRQFENEVKKNPDKFFNFLLQLKSENVHTDYLSAGLQGLIASKYNGEKILKIIHLYSDINNAWLKITILKAINYLIEIDKFDNSLLDFMEKNKEIKYEGVVGEKNKLLTIYDQELSAINSYEGKFAELLPLIYIQIHKDKVLRQRVLKLIHSIINENADFVLFGLLRTLGRIASVDKNLFARLLIEISNKDKIGQISIYLIHDFHYLYINKLINKENIVIFIKKCMNYVKKINANDIDVEVINNFGMYLSYCCLNENDNIFEKLLNEAINVNNQIIHGVLEQIFKRELYSKDKEKVKKSKQLILRFKNSENNDFFYTLELTKMNGLKFIQNDFEFIKDLATSIHIQKDTQGFIEYLQNEYYEDTNIADKIFVLLEDIIYQIDSDTEEEYYNLKPLVEFILEINTRTISNDKKEKILNLIDNFFKSDRLRNNIKAIID